MLTENGYRTVIRPVGMFLDPDTATPEEEAKLDRIVDEGIEAVYGPTHVILL